MAKSSSARASLGSFAEAFPHTAATGGTVSETTTAPAPAPAATPAAKTYPKINVYLTAEEVRTLKLIALDTNQRLSDVAARAIREWMERNGHARQNNA